MVITVGSLTIVTIIVLWAAIDDGSRLKYWATWIAFWNCATALCLIVVVATSYSTYLNTRTFYSATVEQYATSVEMYEDKAVIDIGSAAWTDFKYKGYQENVAGFIKDLRGEIVAYNTMIISKRVMDANPLFNWLVIAPDDDMKIIKMSATNQHLE